MTTAIRALLTRRLDPASVVSYLVLMGLVLIVVAGGVFLVGSQISGL